MKKYILVSVLLMFFTVTAQYTQVPDSNFEQALIDLGYDDVLDGQFLTANVQNVLTLNVNEKNIYDLTGVEAFVNLDQLFAFNNNISTIDLSLLPSDLWTLRLSQNNLTTINLAPVNQLVNLYLNQNNLEFIDTSNMTNLFVLEVAEQPLQNLNVTNCTNLYVLLVQMTNMPTVNLTTCTNLTEIVAHNAQFTSLDFSGNPEIESILAYENPLLESINLPDNPMLDLLGISNTPLTDLDITHCPNLTAIDFSYTNISQIDLSNNVALKSIRSIYTNLESLDITHNPNLEEVFMPWGNISGTIDLSGSSSLKELMVMFNPINAIINIDGAPVLENLDIREVHITELDITQNFIIDNVSALGCPNLEFVNIKNGNNDNLFFASYDSPNLSCVVVDDPNAENQFILVDEDITTLVASPEDCDELSVSDIDLLNFIKLYPNPVKGVLQINTSENITINHIEIYDVLGKRVLVSDVTQVDLSGLASGLFFVHITTNQGVLVKKIIKE